MNCRPPHIAFVSLLLLASASLAGAQNIGSSPIAKALNELVAGMKVRTKLPIVDDYVVTRTQALSVDTEFYESGAIEYHATKIRKDGTRYFLKTYEVKDNTKVLQPGSRVEINKISYFADCIEILWMTTGIADGYGPARLKIGTISLMLANGYETWPVERIVNLLYKVISIPAIDERIDYEGRYRIMTAEVKSAVDSTQAASPSTSLDEQIESMTARYRTYRNAADVAAKEDVPPIVES